MKIEVSVTLSIEYPSIKISLSNTEIQGRMRPEEISFLSILSPHKKAQTKIMKQIFV